MLTVIFKLWNHAVDLSFILDKLLQHMGVRQEVTEGEAERSSHGTRENLPPSCSPILPQPHAATWPPAFMVSTAASRNVALQPEDTGTARGPPFTLPLSITWHLGAANRILGGTWASGIGDAKALRSLLPCERSRSLPGSQLLFAWGLVSFS